MDPDPYPLTPVFRLFRRRQLQLLELVGSGVFGHVYRATLNETTTAAAAAVALSSFETEVAVKVPLKSVNCLPLPRNRILQEIQLLAKLRHPNLVHFIGMVDNASTTAARPWLLMEFAEYGDLQHVLQTTPKEDQPDFCMKATQDIANGMRYLHSELLVHADLHLQNCLVVAGPRVKIGDLGHSFRIVDEEDVLHGVIGKNGRPSIPVKYVDGARWKPPEYVPGPGFDSVLTRPGDVWSFGILLYELWSGAACKPFQGLDDQQVLKALVRGKDPLDYAPTSATTQTQTPCSVLVLMMDCWHFSPNARPSFELIVESLSSDDD